MLRQLKYMWSTKFGKDVAITIIGQVIVLLVAFGLNKILSIRLGTTGFGEYSIIKRTAGVITYIMLAGLGIAIPKYLATYRQVEDKVKEARYIISGLLIMGSVSLLTIVILYILRVPFSNVLFGNSGYEGFIVPTLTYALSLTLTTFVYSYYRGLDKFYRYTTSQIFVQLITLIIGLIFGGDLIKLLYTWSFVTGSYGIYVCICAWIKYYPRADIESYKKSLKSYTNELVSYCLPRIPGEFVLFSFTLLPLIIINYKLGINKAAYFATAISINSMISPLFSFVGLVLLPLVSKSVVSNQFSDANKKIIILAKLYFFVGLVGIIIVEIFTPLVVNILFSIDYQPSVPIIRIIFLAVLPNAFYLLLRNPLDAISKTAYNTINLIVSFIILNILTLFSSTITAYAFSFVISYGVLGVLSIWSWYKCKNEIYKIKNN